MYKLKCLYCEKKWYIEEKDEDSILVCPFCKEDLLKTMPSSFEVVSFESAIQKVLQDNGNEILKNRSRFISYLMDVGFEFKKEVKILTNACDQSTLVSIFEMLYLTPEQAKLTSAKIIHNLVENEGISEIWAKRICLAFLPIKENKTVGYEKEKCDVLPFSNTSNEIENEVAVDMESPIIVSSDKMNESICLKPNDKVKFGGNKWLVLDVKGGAALILSETDYVGSFHDKDRPVDWEICDLRKYLNDEFYQKYFNSDEKKNILLVKNVTMKKNGPLETEDKIFCLCKRDIEIYSDILISNADSFNGIQYILRNNGDHNNYIMTIKAPYKYSENIFINEYGVYSSYKCYYKIAMWVNANYLKLEEK